jgi:hypothetical protein
MARYVLQLENHPRGDRLVDPFDPPSAIEPNDRIRYDRITWRVLELETDRRMHDTLCVIRCTPA